MKEKEFDLGHWAARQRRSYHAGILAVDRVNKLNDIGFDWGRGPRGSLDPNQWNKMLDGLNNYQLNNGRSSHVPRGYVCWLILEDIVYQHFSSHI